jgi:hypothetical protein
MRFVRRFIAIAGLALFGLSQQASAAVLYDNGPPGGYSANAISNGYAISDSFTLSQDSIVTGVNFGVWENPNVTMTSVDWGFATAPGIYTDTATATVTSALTGNLGSFLLSIDSFSTGSIFLAAGTHYLVLQNTVAFPDYSFFWDMNNGPSTATQSNAPPLGSESFQIIGNNVSATPLPAALPLFATGLGAFGLLGWRRKQKAKAA